MVENELYRGKVCSKCRYFYGVGIQLLATSDGIAVEFCILPGGCADLQGLAKLALSLREAAQLFVDSGYNFYEWEDYLAEEENLKLQVPRKANFKRWRELRLEMHKSKMRKYIETKIGEV